MSNVVIPKEQLSAYERWELACFADSEQSGLISSATKKTEGLAEGLAQITEKARQEGYAIGLKQGYNEGMAEANQEHGVMQQALSHIADSLQASLLRHHEQISQDLLNLALEVARGMLKTTLQVDQAAVLAVVKDAISSLPYVQQPAKLILNPADVSVIKQHLDEELLEGWSVIENSAIERGGCLLETAANQIDATNSTRWKRISDALMPNLLQPSTQTLHHAWSDHAHD